MTAILTLIFIFLIQIKHPSAGSPTFGVHEQNRLILEIVVDVVLDGLVAYFTQFSWLEVHVTFYF